MDEIDKAILKEIRLHSLNAYLFAAMSGGHISEGAEMKDILFAIRKDLNKIVAIVKKGGDKSEK